MLEGLNVGGYTPARWQALMLCWAAVYRQGPVEPILVLDPWKDWLPPDLHGFYKWAFDSVKEQVCFSGVCCQEGVWLQSRKKVVG